VNNGRRLKNARIEISKVTENELYNFSSRHALSIYPLDSVCTYIPKNCCSSLRFSIAIENGFVKDIDDINWIHKNNQTFISTQREISIAKYTFVVLRCPYTRIASTYLDKVLDGKINFNDKLGKKVSLNFNEFLEYIKSQSRVNMEEHWRNQSDFLHYELYDDYFSLELFSNAIAILKSKGFKVYDTREALNHDISSFEKVNGDFSKIKEVDLKKMKHEGHLPNYKSMFTELEVNLVNEIYRDDIDLYKSHFGDSALLFK
jgi:hypothetical protein